MSKSQAPDWAPPQVARIRPLPTDGRKFAQSTMSDKDYDRAQRADPEEGTEVGELKDWGPMPLDQPEE